VIDEAGLTLQMQGSYDGFCVMKARFDVAVEHSLLLEAMHSNWMEGRHSYTFLCERSSVDSNANPGRGCLLPV
jgi:hypothetical protein